MPTFDDVEAALVAWVGVGAPGLPVAWEGQGSPVPDGPWVGLGRLTITERERELLMFDELDQAHRVGRRTLQLSVTVYDGAATGPLRAELLAEAILSAARTETVRGLLSAAGLTFRGGGDVVSVGAIPYVIGWEPRARFDARFGAVTSIADSVGLVEHVEILDEERGTEIIVDKPV